jgi:hypothetical protein
MNASTALLYPLLFEFAESHGDPVMCTMVARAQRRGADPTLRFDPLPYL